MNTKIEFGHNKIGRLRDLADLASVLFPHNKRHQRAFLAIFVELKYAPGRTLSSLDWIADKHDVSHRVLEIVRAKMRRLGVIDHVSKFSRRTGYREGWVFSTRFRRSLARLAEFQESLIEITGPQSKRRDGDMFRYL